ncbi:hypothetical protein BT96DRAFT_346207 [Gymnopus androsaceus JB14]|uniref:Uncharacterized protein n=1 Tax=Gymnopus androsaceus JB14 TaxID=1447944 RepID=A0A6A4I3Y3_9AGAR|nr:hypothetical protein BT96DRAFT_346207 [Gymnopus androsaceus JB14]
MVLQRYDQLYRKSSKTLNGIPPWKLFTFTFWGSPIGWQKFMAPQEPWSYNPLGGEWNLVPYQMPDNQFYLGYHLSECQNISYIAPSERKDQVLILANRSASFHRPYNMLDISRWPSIVKGIAGELINLSENEDGYPIPKGLVGLGPQDREAYSLLLRDSKASLGIGHPQLSTGPYASLCHGVPVILPFKSRRCPAHPPSTDWCGFTGNLNLHQHGAIASTLSEPFVYMVDVEERKDDLVATIWRAMKTPIEPIVFPEMTVEALTRRVEDYFHIDWKELAARRMLDRGWNEVVTQEFMYAWLEKHPVTPQIP